MFSNGWLSSLEQVQIFLLCSILLQCAAFLRCLSSGCKGSPARWHVRASERIALKRPHRCCFPTPFFSELRRNTKLETYLCFMNDIYVDGKFEDSIEEVLQELIQQDESDDEE